MDFPARVEQSNGFFRVMVGNYGTLDEATAMEQRIKKSWISDGYRDIIEIHKNNMEVYMGGRIEFREN